MTASVLPLRINKRRSGDLLLLFSVIGLSLTGLLFVYSASKYSAEISYGDKFYFAKKHVWAQAVCYWVKQKRCKIRRYQY